MTKVVGSTNGNETIRFVYEWVVSRLFTHDLNIFIKGYFMFSHIGKLPCLQARRKYVLAFSSSTATPNPFK